MNERKRTFNDAARAALGKQLSPDIEARINARYAACLTRLNAKEQAYTYDKLAGDMRLAILTLSSEITAKKDNGFIQDMPVPPSVAALDFTNMPTLTTQTSTTAAVGKTGAAESALPLDAPPRLAFLNTYPVQWRSDPKWGDVIKSYDKYMTVFSGHRGAGQREPFAKLSDELPKIVQSIQLFSSLPASKAGMVAFRRDIQNIEMNRPFRSVNKEVMGCEESYMMNRTLAQKPGNQVSLAMRVPMLTKSKIICNPVVLSVSAPALTRICNRNGSTM